jgi:hypothetical protein
MNCQNCGVLNSTDSTFCKKCGQPLDIVPSTIYPVRPQTQVAYPYNKPQGPSEPVPATVPIPAPVPATAFAPPAPMHYGQVPATTPVTTFALPPTQQGLTALVTPKSADLANLLELVMPGVGFIYAGDRGGGVAILTGTLMFMLISFILTGIFHQLALLFALVVLLAWFVVRLVIVNNLVKKRNAQGVILKSSTVAGFLEFLCPGIGCFYARKPGSGFAFLFGTFVALVGAGFIAYDLVVQAYEIYNNSAAGVIRSLCIHNPSCANTNTGGPDFSTVFTFLITASVILLIWLIARIVIAISMVQKQKKSDYLWGTVYS